MTILLSAIAICFAAQLFCQWRWFKCQQRINAITNERLERPVERLEKLLIL